MSVFLIACLLMATALRADYNDPGYRDHDFFPAAPPSPPPEEEAAPEETAEPPEDEEPNPGSDNDAQPELHTPSDDD